MHQLSPFKQHTTEIVTNQSRTTMKSSISLSLSKMIDMDLDIIPNYLSNMNPSFQTKMHCILPSTIDLEDLRNVAILVHKIVSIEIIQSLWIVYKKSGTGNLSFTLSLPKQVDRNVWPKEVQSLVKKSPVSSTNQYDLCLTMVNYCLNELSSKSNQYRHELNVLTSRLRNYSRSLEYTIEKFVQENLQQTLRMKIDQEITLIEYYYTDQILQRAYLTQNPTEKQVSCISFLLYSSSIIVMVY